MFDTAELPPTVFHFLEEMENPDELFDYIEGLYEDDLHKLEVIFH